MNQAKEDATDPRGRRQAAGVFLSVAVVFGATVWTGAFATPADEETGDFARGGGGSEEPSSPRDVPLRRWVNSAFPGGLSIGVANGLSWGDYDADGFIDLFACHSGRLWRNLGGTSWQLAANLNGAMPATERRYGSSFADYDNDGLLDIGTEPRVPAWGDDRMHLLNNLGAAGFVDVAGNPAIVDLQPYGNGETLCWADVDGDGNLDAFLPVYPSWASGGPGNFFLRNLGPSGPSGAYRFSETSAAAGLDNPEGTSRPEGAQFADADLDGDPDLFSNGTLYRNVSTPGNPRFDALTEAASGIGLRASVDEGAMLFDYDLDGDFDLFAVYSVDGVRIWENRGDGTFFAAESGIVENPMTGLNLGMSAEDWDNDGDIDFTTRGVFRRNRIVEDGARRFAVATHAIPLEDLISAMPSWGDWDGDGDLDCALANWGREARLYDNTTNGPNGSGAIRNDVSVRIVRNALSVPRGLETEYGATARIDVAGAGDPIVFSRFAASSHGYLNQNSYALHFALPLGRPFDLAVDFPGPGTGDLVRIDGRVNPVLHAIDQAGLPGREITVYRCGQVAVGGSMHEPDPLADPALVTTTGGLAQPTATEGLPDLVSSPGADWYTGLVFDTNSGTEPVVVKEIVIDGVLDEPVACGGASFNIALWDVTRPSDPVIAEGGAIAAHTPDRNRRTWVRTDIVLDPGRKYRLVARVRSVRPTPINSPVQDGPIRTQGSIDFANGAPCSGSAAVAARLTRSQVTMALRFASATASGTADPVGDSLRLGRDAQTRPVLGWTGAGTTAHQVLRCDARGGPCQPAHLALAASSPYLDTAVTVAPGEIFWYRVQAVNDCTAQTLGSSP